MKTEPKHELFKQLFIECPDQILDTDDEIWDIAEQLETDTGIQSIKY